MSVLVCDPTLAERLIAERQESGGDRYDEVWDGVYVMSPIANNEHQELVYLLSDALGQCIDKTRHERIFPGCNVSDQEKNWTHNYRCPDVAVFLAGNTAEDRDTHWFGGPDFAVEIISPHDRSREKFDFYAAVEVRELLMIDRDPWLLELFRLTDGEMVHVGTSSADLSDVLASRVLPVDFRLTPAAPRPLIEIRHLSEPRSWRV